MLVQTGANGNVFGYNYSLENHVDEAWTPCDISLHGHWPYMNLFEGNVVQEIDIADYWGPCGPGNTFLRNRVQTEGFDVYDHSHEQNIVGNELGAGQRINIESTVTSTLVHGNCLGGVVQWDAAIADHVIPASYYLAAKPAFFGALAWPVAAGCPDTGLIPAQARFNGGNPFEVEAAKNPGPVMISCLPNPFSRKIRIIVSRDVLEAGVYHLNGKRIADLKYREPGLEWDASALPSGVYLLRARVRDGVMTKKLVHYN
jgi:hypothetical protein